MAVPHEYPVSTLKKCFFKKIQAPTQDLKICYKFEKFDNFGICCFSNICFDNENGI